MPKLSFAARQAIMDAEHQHLAYELLFRDGENNQFPNIEPEQATSALLDSGALVQGIDILSNGKISHINFSQQSLGEQFPNWLEPNQVVIEISANEPANYQVCEHLRALVEKGFTIALDDYQFQSEAEDYLNWVRIVKVNVRNQNFEQLAHQIQPLKDRLLSLIALRVESYDEFKQLVDMGFKYFQGYYFAKPEVIQYKSLPATKANLIDLIGESSKAKLDFNRISKIMQHDVSLSYKLLRFVNSSLFSNSQQIASLRHALTYLGEVEVKKFIALIAAANLSDEKPRELLALSIIRARFCQGISEIQGDESNPPKAFLAGLFSLVDAILDQSLPHIMRKLPLLDEIKDALLNKQGKLADYIKLVQAYEKAHWDDLNEQAEQLGVAISDIHEQYVEAMQWANEFAS